MLSSHDQSSSLSSVKNCWYLPWSFRNDPALLIGSDFRLTWSAISSEFRTGLQDGQCLFMSAIYFKTSALALSDSHSPRNNSFVLPGFLNIFLRFISIRLLRFLHCLGFLGCFLHGSSLPFIVFHIFRKFSLLPRGICRFALVPRLRVVAFNAWVDAWAPFRLCFLVLGFICTLMTFRWLRGASNRWLVRLRAPSVCSLSRFWTAALLLLLVKALLVLFSTLLLLKLFTIWLACVVAIVLFQSLSLLFFLTRHFLLRNFLRERCFLGVTFCQSFMSLFCCFRFRCCWCSGLWPWYVLIHRLLAGKCFLLRRWMYLLLIAWPPRPGVDGLSLLGAIFVLPLFFLGLRRVKTSNYLRISVPPLSYVPLFNSVGDCVKNFGSSSTPTDFSFWCSCGFLFHSCGGMKESLWLRWCFYRMFCRM